MHSLYFRCLALLLAYSSVPTSLFVTFSVNSEFRYPNEKPISFGYSLSVGKKHVIIGAQLNSTDRGSVCIFSRKDSTELEQVLIPEESEAKYFGSCSSLLGDELLLGASAANFSGIEESGAIYSFSKNLSVWKRNFLFTSEHEATGDKFGWSCKLEDKFMYVGAPFGQNQGDGLRAGFVSVLDTHGALVQRIYASDRTSVKAQFGSSFDIHGSNMVIGSPRDSTDGVTYIFQKDSEDNRWKELMKLEPQNLNRTSEFGYSVSIFGDIVAVGSPGESSVYIYYSLNSSYWELKDKIQYPNNSRLGATVRLKNNLLIIGSDGGANYVSILERNNDSASGFQFLQDVSVPNLRNEDLFGYKIEVEENSLYVAAPTYGSVFEFSYQGWKEDYEKVGVNKSNKIWIVVAVSVGLFVAMIIVLAAVLTGRKKRADQIKGEPENHVTSTEPSVEQVTEVKVTTSHYNTLHTPEKPRKTSDYVSIPSPTKTPSNPQATKSEGFRQPEFVPNPYSHTDIEEEKVSAKDEVIIKPTKDCQVDEEELEICQKVGEGKHRETLIFQENLGLSQRRSGEVPMWVGDYWNR